jgi:5'-nucleotidase
MLYLPKPILLSDADNVMYKWEHRFIADVLAEDPNYPIMPFGTRTEMEMGVDGVEHEIVVRVKTRPGFYLGLEPMEGSQKALKEIQKFGFDVLVCTAPALSNPTCASDKYAAIKRDFGKGLADRTIITKDKTLVRGEVLVDDKPVITGLLTPTWEHIVFDRSYNRHVPNQRINGDWSNWEEVLTPVMEAHKARFASV